MPLKKQSAFLARNYDLFPLYPISHTFYVVVPPARRFVKKLEHEKIQNAKREDEERRAQLVRVDGSAMQLMQWVALFTFQIRLQMKVMEEEERLKELERERAAKERAAAKARLEKQAKLNEQKRELEARFKKLNKTKQQIKAKEQHEIDDFTFVNTAPFRGSLNLCGHFTGPVYFRQKIYIQIYRNRRAAQRSRGKPHSPSRKNARCKGREGLSLSVSAPSALINCSLIGGCLKLLLGSAISSKVETVGQVEDAPGANSYSVVFDVEF